MRPNLKIMDEENIKSWVTQPDVCRCCLSTSGTWDLSGTYNTGIGIKEVFSDMLQECYGISLSYLSEWGPSHVVCGLCVGHLREACSFRKQVVKAEEYFLKYYNYRKDEFKIKLEEESHNYDDDSNMMFEDNKNKLKAEMQYSKKDYRNVVKTRQKTTKFKRKKKKEIEYDSDVPISELSKKTEHLGDNNKGCDDNSENINNLVTGNELIFEENTIAINYKGSNVTQCVKPLSERKQVILTCETVIKETTACPFRHYKSWFQCFFCTNEFMDMTSLREHIAERHQNIEQELSKMKRYPRSLQIDISDLKCRQCHVNLADIDSMCRHFASTHNKIIYKESIADYKVDCSPYSCHLCKQEFHVFRTLTTHLNEHYANCICDVCGRSFLNSKRLKVHKKTHENGQFPCSECGKIFKTQTSKANHMESAHSKRVIKCQLCFKPMKHYNDRIKHMSEVHNITHLFKCKICFKEYNIKHYLATHMRQTHGNKNKKCLECGMAFITNHGLKKHMSKHTGVKPHKCGVCGKAYARRYTLREHMRTHESEKRFLCTE